MEEEFPQDVKSLIIDSIDSALQVEIILRLQIEPERAWTAGELAQELRIDPAFAIAQLDHLSAIGLIARQTPAAPFAADDMTRFKYLPPDAPMRRSVDGLARAYTQRRVTVIGMIFSKPVEKIRSFANAFRIRKEKSDG